MRLLVTGGAGYIGSVVASSLIEAGHKVTVLDDLSTGHADAVPPKAAFIRGTLRDDAARVLSEGIDAVLHFAAESLVGESVENPALYWSHNLGGSLALLEAMRETGVHRIVFSSTAAVYGEPEHTRSRRPTRPGRPAPTAPPSSPWTRASASSRGCAASAQSACATSTWRARIRIRAGSGTGNATSPRRT